jgi:hypothetical protein
MAKVLRNLQDGLPADFGLYTGRRRNGVLEHSFKGLHRRGLVEHHPTRHGWRLTYAGKRRRVAEDQLPPVHLVPLAYLDYPPLGPLAA